MSNPYESVRYHSLQGRGVVITGGASGIGAEMVRAFISQGARVAFLDNDHEAGTALVAELPDARFIGCDVTDIAALRDGLERIECKWPIEALFNNAARDNRHKMADVEPEHWRHTLAVNLDHQFFASQEVSRGMIARGRGTITMMGSVSWMRARPGMVGYTTAKAAINGLTRTMASELGASGIRVNCIVPGAIRTERQDKLWGSPEQNQLFLDDQALKFRLDAFHIARMALFLASDEAAGCTGANFTVDAGITLG